MATGRLQGKVCVVTGSSSGLGRAISLGYSQQGASLICADLRPTARQEVPSEVTMPTDQLIRQNGGNAIFIRTDVSKADDWQALVSKAVETYGRIDVLVNNAGISIESQSKTAKVHETSEETWDITMAVNVKSIFLGCKYVIAQMLKQDLHHCGDRGWIINLSSIYGLIGGRYNISYAASKGAVTNLTRTVALDYADARIHCNAICPGYTRTAIFARTVENMESTEALDARHPLRGVGKPEDIVGSAIFLASEDAAWVTGVNLPVDGGYTAQ